MSVITNFFNSLKTIVSQPSNPNTQTMAVNAYFDQYRNLQIINPQGVAVGYAPFVQKTYGTTVVNPSYYSSITANTPTSTWVAVQTGTRLDLYVNYSTYGKSQYRHFDIVTLPFSLPANTLVSSCWTPQDGTYTEDSNSGGFYDWVPDGNAISPSTDGTSMLLMYENEGGGNTGSYWAHPTPGYWKLEFILPAGWTIPDVPAPTIAGTPPAGTVGTAYTYTPTITYNANPVVSLFSGGLPAGLSLDPSTGIISGTPTAAGTSTAILIITQEDGQTGNESISITIAAS